MPVLLETTLPNLFRRGKVSVSVMPALLPGGDDWDAALALRNACRALIVAECGEADLDAVE